MGKTSFVLNFKIEIPQRNFDLSLKEKWKMIKLKNQRKDCVLFFRRIHAIRVVKWKWSERKKISYYLREFVNIFAWKPHTKKETVIARKIVESMDNGF